MKINAFIAILLLICCTMIMMPVGAMTWQSELLNISNVPGQGYDHLFGGYYNTPKIILDSADHPHVFFTLQGSPAGDSIPVYMYKEGSSWQSMTIGTSHIWPRIHDAVLDSSGNPHIFYSAGSPGAHTIRHAYREGSTWYDVDIGHVFNDVPVSVLAAAIDSDGYAHVLYYRVGTSPVYPLKYAKLSYDGLYNYSETLDPGGWYTYEGDLAFDAEGHPAVVYLPSTYTSDHPVFYATRTETGWTTEQIDTTSSSLDYWVYARLEFDSSGHPNVMYVYSHSSPKSIKFAHKDSGGWTFESVEYTPRPSFALDENDAPFMVGYHPYFDIWLGWRGVSGWLNETIANPYYSGGLFSSIDIDSMGRVHIVTQEQLSSNQLPAGIKYYLGIRNPPLVVPPNAEFISVPLVGEAPLNVYFFDTSNGNPTSWIWDFGDKGTSSDQNPTHEYEKAGRYTVTLTVSNSVGSDTIIKRQYITVNRPVTVKANFIADVRRGPNPLTVQFTDLSSDTPDDWLWDFGDGGTSTDQHPSHMYSSSGRYTVTLTVQNSYDNAQITKRNYITVT